MIAAFDTNIIVDALNGVMDANAEYNRYERVLISRITWIEVLVGAREDEDQLRDFLDSHFEIIPLDQEVAEVAIRLRREQHLRIPDAIILATALVNNTILVTRNTKDFKPEWDSIRVPYMI